MLAVFGSLSSVCLPSCGICRPRLHFACLCLSPMRTAFACFLCASRLLLSCEWPLQGSCSSLFPGGSVSWVGSIRFRWLTRSVSQSGRSVARSGAARRRLSPVWLGGSHFRSPAHPVCRVLCGVSRPCLILSPSLLLLARFL